MGTNYYLINKESPSPCPTCGHHEKPKKIHIGKSSFGWVFALHVYPDTKSCPQNLHDWIGKFEDNKYLIRDEYGTTISSTEMIKIITKREKVKDASEREFSPYSKHDFKVGLRRLKLDSSFCIENGEGTWDLCVGEFS